MKFEQGIIILKKANPNHLIIAKCGIFYYAIGNDALIIEKELKLKKTCLKKYMCKVGILEKALKENLEILRKKEYKYIVYQYSKNQYLSFDEQFVELCRNDFGNKKIDNIYFSCEDCKNASNNKIQQNLKEYSIYEQTKLKEFEEHNVEEILKVKEIINKLIDEYIKEIENRRIF